MQLLHKQSNNIPLKFHFMICFILLLGFHPNVSVGVEPERPETPEVGGLVPEGTFTDIDGKAINLRELAKKNKGLVIAFHSVSCPVSQQYGPTLARMEPDFRKKGLKLIIVNPYETDKPEQIKQLRSQFPGDTPYILDYDDKLTNAMGARSTTEAFLVDSAFTIVYRGAVDNQFTTERKLPEPTEDWLESAIFELSRNVRIVKPVTDPSGCVLETDVNITTVVSHVTYHNRISRIILQNCIQCHHNDGVAPFPLETYEDVKDHKSMIKLVLRTNEMPPWPASDDFEPDHPGFENDMTLSGAEKRDLLKWLSDPELPLGDPALDPIDYQFTKGDWAIGKPDIITQLPEPIQLPAQGIIAYQVVDVDLNLKEDIYIDEWELQPTDIATVHHALVYVIPERHKLTEAEKNDPLADHKLVPEFLFAYVPGFSYTKEPKDNGRKIAKGSRLRFQIHYVTKGVATSDQLKFGMKLMKKKPKYLDMVHTLVNLGIKIPAGESNHIETISQHITDDIYIQGFQPHMHYRGKSMKYELIYPDKHRLTLLDVPNWDFEWQYGYALQKPILAPKGSTLFVTAVYDNSEDNINNPDSTKDVTWGPYTEDEMFISGFDYRSINNKHVSFPIPVTSGAAGAFLKILLNRTLRDRVFRFLDADHDGFVTRKEMDQIIVFAPDLKDRPDRIDNMMNLLDIDADNRWDKEEFDAIEDFFD